MTNFKDIDVANLNNLLLGIGNIIQHSKENIVLAKDLDLVSVVKDLPDNDNAVYKEIKNFLIVSLK